MCRWAATGTAAARRYLNLFITMLLGGLWHGANWTFMLWGGLHGFYLAINHAFRHATKGVTAAARLAPAAAYRLGGADLRRHHAWPGSCSARPTLPRARNVVGGLLGLGHSAVVSFSPLAAVTLLLLFVMVWLMPNSAWN